MAIENSGRIKHLKKIGTLNEVYNVRTGYHRATCLRCPLTKYWISKWPSIARRNRWTTQTARSTAENFCRGARLWPRETRHWALRHCPIHASAGPTTGSRTEENTPEIPSRLQPAYPLLLEKKKK